MGTLSDHYHSDSRQSVIQFVDAGIVSAISVEIRLFPSLHVTEVLESCKSYHEELVKHLLPRMPTRKLCRARVGCYQRPGPPADETRASPGGSLPMPSEHFQLVKPGTRALAGQADRDRLESIDGSAVKIGFLKPASREGFCTLRI